jgi:hypothetical protein
MITRYLSILLLLLYTASIVHAENESIQTDKKSVNKEKVKSTKTNVNKRAQVKTLEEFIPSEEVSADKPVAFPNDI